ncbi:MAG TPA: hypothetical protein DD399_13845 [Alcanivorax sp.]|jgi:hypothetical protein|nr:hypothetical protein [Alcanivorax sp.]HIK76077.1 hypothetical protein [Alcanivorax sp.]|tara:strand:+ start:279 stop:734 length:456 start_codon:yes stop_codon:yes gene_type:complete
MITARYLPLVALLSTMIGSPSVLAAGGGDAAGAVPAQVLSEQGLYRVEVRQAPEPLPKGEHFSLGLRVVSMDNPDTPLEASAVTVEAGMRHGRDDGFAHGMQSEPVVSVRDGLILVEGLYFHMGGAWTLQVTIDGDDGEDQAWLTLPCCGG